MVGMNMLMAKELKIKNIHLLMKKS
ncbi:hypothetical protein [Spiroplasma endosymbiont of Dactylopius coccus]